jgi:hypothetical protein
VNRFDTGQQALMKRLKATSGRTVTYTPGTISAGVYTAGTPVVFSTANNQGMWVGNSLFALAPKSPGGARVQWGDRDYFCAVADFQDLVGAGLLPTKGDRIQDVDPNGNTVVFELNTPTNEPVWRYSDQTRQEFRLHCKRVA